MNQLCKLSQVLRKKTIAQNFANAFDYDRHATIQRKICQLLIEQIADSKHSRLLEIGAGTGQLTKLLADKICANTIICQDVLINELAAGQFETLQTILPNAQVIIGDAESLEFGQDFSLIISANAIQWFDEPLNFIDSSYSRLISNGQLLFNTFSPQHFLQIKTLTGQGLTYPSKNDWQERLTQIGFSQIQITTKRFELSFPEPMAVLKHMKLTGVSTNNAHNAFVWNKSRLNEFQTNYQQQFFNPNKPTEVILTYEALIISAIKP
ncbi:methyltransferase domain-containing protein [Psychrobacter ciconiae]|uniref:methyltransferase domain-containing protein n=1 Tax=Psychrobacter ciconiae TaxID=1553449 RepID=UPI0019188F9E|nr:methyltransferase domain-containing protein [Psychrobacter ciconiae]